MFITNANVKTQSSFELVCYPNVGGVGGSITPFLLLGLPSETVKAVNLTFCSSQ